MTVVAVSIWSNSRPTCTTRCKNDDGRRIRIGKYFHLFTSDKGGGKCVCPRSFVCLSVCWQDYSKTRAWIWMKCCVSTDVGTWTKWLTFEPYPDYIPDAGTGLLSPISYALQCEILLRRENTTYRYWAPVGTIFLYAARAAPASCTCVLLAVPGVRVRVSTRSVKKNLPPVAASTRGFKMVLFTASHGNNFVGGTRAPPNALLVGYLVKFIYLPCWVYNENYLEF